MSFNFENFLSKLCWKKLIFMAFTTSMKKKYNVLVLKYISYVRLHLNIKKKFISFVLFHDTFVEEWFEFIQVQIQNFLLILVLVVALIRGIATRCKMAAHAARAAVIDRKNVLTACLLCDSLAFEPKREFNLHIVPQF